MVGRNLLLPLDLQGGIQGGLEPSQRRQGRVAVTARNSSARRIVTFFLLVVVCLAILTSCTNEPTPFPSVTPTSDADSRVSPPPTAALPPTPSRTFSRYDFQFVEAFGGHVWERPIDIAFLPDGESALVAEQIGQVHRVFFDARRDPILTFSIRERVSRASNEEGLLSLALDPKFEENGRVWMYYSVQGGIRRTRLSWFTVDEYIADWSSEHHVYELIQPYGNHNGGKILFDNNGYLYLGLGDGGSLGDPQSNGQDLSNVYGTIIRLDISQSSDDEPYRIPPDNPFLDDPDIPDEIWAYGLRNPWRMTFDPATDLLWIGDVGQSYRDEINVVNTLTDGGTNFGWSTMEGTACFRPRRDCNQTGMALPIEDYPPRSGHCSVIAGPVYRGAAIPSLNEALLYSDHCKGEIRIMDATDWTNGSVALKPIAPENTQYDNPAISSFGTDNKGEIYILRFNGPILKMVPGEESP